MNNSRYKLAGPQISSEAFDDEYVVLNLESGRYFSLTGGAAIIWRAMLAGHSPVALSASLPTGSPAATAFSNCFAQILDAGLLAPDSQDGAGAPELAAQLLAVDTDYRIEAFDDLAALLIADPIHDVETEAGWPHRAA